MVDKPRGKQWAAGVSQSRSTDGSELSRLPSRKAIIPGKWETLAFSQETTHGYRQHILESLREALSYGIAGRSHPSEC